MFIRRRRPTLAGEMLILQLAIVVVVLLAVGAISLAQSAATFDRVEGRRVTALAEQLAWNPLLRAFYQRLRMVGKPAKLALTAVARKLLVYLNAILRDQRPWRYA